ncbi:tetratricopeptide repeat protein [Candidatus Peregrinibacteria bacterium]|nr:tetratricopeptide repeat protein [Candidatus Peregrinibacteria bacterium]
MPKMKIPPRILVPVVSAVLIAGGLVGFLWLRLSDSAERLRDELRQVIDLSGDAAETFVTDAPIDRSDRALLHLRQGDLFAIQGQWAKAQEEYEQSVDAGGGIAALRKLAQAQLQRRNIGGVRTTIRRLRQEGARPEDLLLLESVVDLRTGELQKARQLLTGAQDSPQKHYGLALLAIIEGTHDQAKTELALTMSGWDPLLRAYARTLQSAYDEFDLFPESQELHLITLLSRALAQVQECELALPLLVQVIREQDDYRDAWIVQGYCELVTERFEQSLASLERAYAIDPEKPEVQYFLGRAHAALGDHQNAVTFFTYAQQNGFKPEKEVRRLIAEQATELGNADLALEQYQALADRLDADRDAYIKLVTLQMTLDKNDEAYATALKAVAKWPDEASIQELLGSAAEANGNEDVARAAYEKALQLDPTLVGARERLQGL